jgi:hypothetical protein
MKQTMLSLEEEFKKDNVCAACIIFMDNEHQYMYDVYGYKVEAMGLLAHLMHVVSDMLEEDSEDE